MSEHSTYRMMYMNALIGLENGHLMPWDKDILASAPLPDSVIDPFTTKEMPDVLESMKLTFNAMSIWVDEAKKVNYFSKRFVQLSRMVMNGVTTMGRGLVTLHARGEDLSQSPMSIQDLLGVASYHFRKSYLGVLQTSRSHPEIGERLLMNQIGWNNMLMRLFKTRDKLNSGVRIQGPGAKEEQGARIENPVVSGLVSGAGNKAGRMKNEDISSGQDSEAMCRNLGTSGQEAQALPDTSDLLVQALRSGSHTSDLKSPISTLTPPSALTEPGAFTAPRAFSSYDSVPKRGLLPKATVPIHSLNPSGQAPDGTSPKAEKLPKGTVKSTENQTSEMVSIQVGAQEDRHDDAGSTEQDAESHVLDTVAEQTVEMNEEKSFGTEHTGTGNFCCEANTRVPVPMCGPEIAVEKKEDNKETETKEGNKLTGAGYAAHGDRHTSAGSAAQVASPHVLEDSGDSPMKGKSPPSELPSYLQILKNVFARSGPSEDGKLTFTYEEICYLASDPDFNRIYPDQAAQMRSIRQQMNSS